MLAWLLCYFSGDPHLYCLKTLYFVIFQGGGGSRPLPPSGSVYAHESQKVCSFAPGNHNMSHYEKIGYNIDVLQHTACLLVNPIMVDNFAFLFHCRRVYLTSYGPRREKTCLRGFRLSEFQTSLLSYSD